MTRPQGPQQPWTTALTIGQLVAHLLTLDQDLPVMSDGYEGGVNDISIDHIEIAPVAPMFNYKDPYVGDHEEVSSMESWQLEYITQHGMHEPVLACIIHKTQHG